jgi:hypothetical protein
MTCAIVYNILMVLAMVQFSDTWARTQRSSSQVLAKSTADLLVPILDLRYDSVRECGIGKDFRCTKPGPAADRDTARWGKVAVLVARLQSNETRPADEALVVLLQYYVGESESFDLMADIAKRGKRELPYLLKYRDLVPRIPGRNYPNSILTDRDFRKHEFDETIGAIKRGKTLSDD